MRIYRPLKSLFIALALLGTSIFVCPLFRVNLNDLNDGRLNKRKFNVGPFYRNRKKGMCFEKGNIHNRLKTEIMNARGKILNL